MYIIFSDNKQDIDQPQFQDWNETGRESATEYWTYRNKSL